MSANFREALIKYQVSAKGVTTGYTGMHGGIRGLVRISFAREVPALWWDTRVCG
jgi:hypothetical protein